MTRAAPRRAARFGRRGGATAPWSPLGDPDLLAMWIAADATDDGTTLTIPDRGWRGLHLTATGGSGRPSIDADGFAGLPGIDFSGLSAGWSTLRNAAIGALLSSQAAGTFLLMCAPSASAATTSYLAVYGGTAAGDFRWLGKQPGAGQHTVTWYAATASTHVSVLNGDTIYTPQVMAVTFDGAAVSHKVSAIRDDGDALPGTWTADGGPSAFSSQTLYIGAQSTGASPTMYILGGAAFVKRALTEAEINRWGEWMRARYSTMATQPKRVLHVGDSIVAATGGRQRIWDLYAAAAAAGTKPYGRYQPVGNLGIGATWIQNWHSAVSGSRVSTCQTRLTTTDLVSGTAFRLPDVVMTRVGINDITLDASSAATLATAWENYLVACYDVLPSASHKLVSMINNTSGGGVYAATVLAANALGPTAVANAKASRPGLSAEWVDGIYTVELVDGTHPTAAGYTAMGDADYALVMNWIA